MNKCCGNVFSLVSALLMMNSLLLGEDILSIPHSKESIKLDGYLDESVWNDVESLPLIMHWPTFREEPTESTQFMVLYNDEYLYLGARCFDDPEGIQGPSFQRDAWDMNIDHVAIILDTFNDNENALLFGVSPTGHRIDVAIVNDAAE